MHAFSFLWLSNNVAQVILWCQYFFQHSSDDFRFVSAFCWRCCNWPKLFLCQHDCAANYIKDSLTTNILYFQLQHNFLGKEHIAKKYIPFLGSFQLLILTNSFHCPFSSLIQYNVTGLPVIQNHLVLWCLLSACLALLLSVEAIWVATSSSCDYVRFFLNKLLFEHSSSALASEFWCTVAYKTVDIPLMLPSTNACRSVSLIDSLNKPIIVGLWFLQLVSSSNYMVLPC